MVSSTAIVRNRWPLLLTVLAPLLWPAGARAEEASGTWFINLKQSGAWTGDGLAPALIQPRLGYRRSSGSFDWSVQAGPRFVGAERADWAASLEMAWQPRPALEVFGEWEPILSTAPEARGLLQDVRAGLVLSLGEGPVRFDDIQDFAAAVRGLYLKVEQRGTWGVGGEQLAMSASPRLGWSLSQDPVKLSLEAGPGFVFPSQGAERTDLFGEMDLTVTLSRQWSLYLEYRPSIGFVPEAQTWVHRLKGGVVFAF